MLDITSLDDKEQKMIPEDDEFLCPECIYDVVDYEKQRRFCSIGCFPVGCNKFHKKLEHSKPQYHLKPAEQVAWSRIAELAEAILHQCKMPVGEANPDLCEMWIDEIKGQCWIIESQRDYEADGQLKKETKP